MAGTLSVKLFELLKSIGVDVSQQQASNVKKLAPKNKSTSTKVGLLAAERDTGGNFATVLDIFKKDAQYIDSMNDVEKMNFLNNVMDYKEFGGSSIKNTEGIKLLDEAKNLTDEAGDLQTSISDLQSTAKTMKDDAEASLASAKKDLDDFITTGGQPLKAKSDKYLGGSMHEEGQLRTAIRTFLKNEYKNGRIKLDKDDQFRIMEYSPMMEDDPIKVFKKIYGEEAYTKAGTFPGAFEKGESFNHYESIFKENMGEDILKVKDKKYVGDGKLILTKQEEVFEPTPDEDVPFAKGGRASFVGGKVVDELVAMLVKKEPMDAMKEVNKIIGKKGKYKNLTQKDIDRIVDQTNDHIFQRDPDNLYVGDRKIKPYDKATETQFNKDVEEAGGMEKFLDENPISADDMSLEDSLTTLEGLGATQTAERFRLKQKYPGLNDDLLTNIIEDTDPVHKASVLAKIDMAMELGKTNKSADEIIDILKKEPETKMATGGRAGFSEAGSVRKDPDEIVAGMDNELNPGFFDKLPLIGGYEGKYPVDADQGASLIEEIQDYKYGESYPNETIGVMEEGIFNVIPKPNRPSMSMEETIKALEAKWDMAIEEGYKPGKGGEFDDLGIYSKEDIRRRIELGYDQAKGPEIKTGIMTAAAGGRAGYYSGGQAMIEPDLSDVGHGSDALMARTRLTAPGSQATTSTGLNYLLGEDNDNTRIPFNQGNTVLPKSKPAQSPLIELSRIYKTYEDAMPGVSKDTQKYLQQDFIKKLNNAGISQEAFMTYRMQNSYPEGRAYGGRIGFQDGLNFKKFYDKKLEKAIDKMLEKETEEDINILEKGVEELNKKSLDKVINITETRPTRDKFPPGRLGNKEYELALDKYYETEKGKKEQENEMFKMVEEFQTLKKKGIIDRNTPFERFKKMKEQRLVKNKILELDIKYPEKEIINKETGALNEENLKEAIDQAEVDLEISPIDGLTLKRSINTEGEQSVTGGSFDLGNLNFSSDNIEEGKLTSKGNYTFGGVDLSGMINSNDGEILNTELGFNYDNALKGKINESDGYRSTELDLNKTFPINDKFNLNLKGGADTQTFDGKTYRSSDLTPKLSYNDGIFNADISKEILEGGGDFSLNAGASFPLFEKTFTGDLILNEKGEPTYNSDGSLKRKSNTTKDMGVLTLKGTDLFTDNMGGTIGYKKNILDKDNLKFSIGGEMDPFSGEKTGGGYLSYKFADGGIAGLRQGYNKGNIVDKGRRGFLKLLGVTAGGVAALKTGLVKLLGKDSGAISKKVIDEVIIEGGTGAPAWLQPLVNKALREGIDKTKGSAYKDAQVVKSLDTPTGNVDVYYDVRTGEVEIDYIGGNTALGESVNMRYTPGIADEGTKGKPADTFEATESIPEGRQTGPDDYSIEMGENTTDDVKNLYSDVSELQTLGGDKTLINDISVTLQKKKKLKQMQDNPTDFVTDVQGDYDPT